MIAPRSRTGDLQPDSELVAASVNGAPGFEVRVAGALDAVATVQVENGLVRTIYVVRNPGKLARVRRVTSS